MSPRGRLTAPAVIASVAASLLAASLAGCAASHMPAVSAAPASPPPPHGRVTLKVGAARADVTPPPGAGTFGHGPDGRVAEGYWSRLYCRAFVFDVGGGAPFAIVPCDLGAISTLLQRRVAELTQKIGITAPRLMITATHTHAGPAHYFDGQFYGGLMSSRLPGYDDAMVSFLAERIAKAVRDAYDARTDAAIAWAHTEEWELTRNRSLVPYLANRPRYAPTPPDNLDLPEEQRAIDPNVHILRIDAIPKGDPEHPLRPIGSITFIAMHPTVLPNTNRLYGADVDGVVSRAIEREMRRDAAPGIDPLHAVVSTNEGDVSPVWARGTTEEAQEIGGRLARRVWGAYRDAGSHLEDRVVVDTRYVEVNLRNAELADGKRRLCSHAEMGSPTAGGASDHPTSLDWVDGWREGVVDLERADLCERPREELVAPLQNLVGGLYAFPSRVPLALAQLGDTLISFVPAEVTITAGARMNAAALAAQSGPEQATHAVVASLANGYLSYVTTPEEFSLQHYEGSSNLYGPFTAPLFAERLAGLARAMDGEPPLPSTPTWPRIGEATDIAYKVGPVRPRLPREGDESSLESIGPSRAPIGLCTIAHAESEPPSFCFWWGDGGPARVGIQSAPWVVLAHDGDATPPGRGARARAVVTTCGAPLFSGTTPATCDPSATVDDRGLDFETRAHGAWGDAWAWSTLFHPTRAEWRELGAMGKVRIVAGDIASPAFSVTGLPSSCSVRAERWCGVR